MSAKSQLTATAGEHFVAYKVASLGFLPAFVRQGAPGIDLVASSIDGGKTVGIQVKSTEWASREKGRGSERRLAELQFPLGHRAIESTSDKAIFCFVDLRIHQPDKNPDVYVISASQLKREYKGVNIRKHTFFRHHRPVEHMEPYKNNWEPLKTALQ